MTVILLVPLEVSAANDPPHYSFFSYQYITMTNPKFIGTVGWNEVIKTITKNPWEPIAFDWSPFPVVVPPPHYLFTLGSGCFSSMATTSIYNQTYHSAIDVFRQDYINGTVVIDVDHYIAQMGKNSYFVYQYPPVSYHHLKPQDKILTCVPIAWQAYLDKVTKGKIVL